jgi:cation diffusion facilitator family transporter
MSSKLKAASVSISVNVVLLFSKIIVAILTGSIGLIAESAHSLFDLLASFLAYLGIKKAEQPSDDKHHFGHHKFENLSSMLQALLITGTSFIVIWESYHKFLKPTPVENSWLGILLMIITIPVTLLTSRYLSKMAKSSGGSQALEADSAHFFTDVLASVAVLIGLLLVHFGFGYGDPLSALIVGVIMLYISIHLLRTSFKVFMDYGPDAATLKQIEVIIIKDKRIRSYHNLKARMAGSQIFLEFHIRVEKKMHITTAHEISHQLKDRILRKIPQITHCTIHIEPD